MPDEVASKFGEFFPNVSVAPCDDFSSRFGSSNVRSEPASRDKVRASLRADDAVFREPLWQLARLRASGQAITQSLPGWGYLAARLAVVAILAVVLVSWLGYSYFGLSRTVAAAAESVFLLASRVDCPRITINSDSEPMWLWVESVKVTADRTVLGVVMQFKRARSTQKDDHRPTPLVLVEGYLTDNSGGQYEWREATSVLWVTPGGSKGQELLHSEFRFERLTTLATHLRLNPYPWLNLTLDLQWPKGSTLSSKK